MGRAGKPSVRAMMFLKVLQRAKHGTIHLSLPDGRNEIYGQGFPEIKVIIKDWRAIDLMFNRGDLGLADAIIEDLMEVDDTAKLIEWACLNDHDLAEAANGRWYGTILAKLKHFMNRNDRSGARSNIMAHYDLGNEFYKLWLDPTMSYSSGIFAAPGMSLKEAQLKKYDRIIEALNLKAEDHLLEIGCGWGGFFSRAVERTGCRVTAVMNSPEQARFNAERIVAQKMSGHVNLIQQDYRDIRGSFDKVASIEMVEAVGERYWGDYFGKVGSSLKSNGTAVIQGITIREDLFNSYRKTTDFIQQYVFPGGMLLTHNTFKNQGRENHMALSDVYEFGISYADTLKMWRENFNAVREDILRLGFDDKFIRLWNLYLCYCEGAFRAGRINVGQFSLVKA